MLRKLVVVRHGETLWNSEFRMQGLLNSPLTDKGKRQADENGQLLGRMGVEALLVSPLGRTQETAEIINTHVKAEIALFDELVERDCGEWGGLTMSAIKSERAAEWQARLANEWEHRPPGGENMPDVIARIAPLLRAVRKMDVDTLGIVSHGVVGKAILAHCLALTGDAAGHIRQPNDVVYVLDFSAHPVRCEHYRRGAGPHPGVVRSPHANIGGGTGQ